MDFMNMFPSEGIDVCSEQPIDSSSSLSELLSNVLDSADDWPQSRCEFPELKQVSSSDQNRECNFWENVSDVSKSDFRNAPLPPFQAVALKSNVSNSFDRMLNFGKEFDSSSVIDNLHADDSSFQWNPPFVAPKQKYDIQDHFGDYCFCPSYDTQPMLIKVEQQDNEVCQDYHLDGPDQVFGGISHAGTLCRAAIGEQNPVRYYSRAEGEGSPFWQDWSHHSMQSGEGPRTPPELIGVDHLDEEASKHVGSKRVEGKKCGVCGDRALGYNFNAITCESCKAFFRRNALKNKEFRCPFTGNCEVTAVTRRFCQRCRLRKCFDVGMKKEWIMTDDEKKKKKKKIEENRQRKIGDIDLSDFGGESFDESSLPSPEESISSPTTTTEPPKPPLLSQGSVTNKPSMNSKPQAVVVGRVRAEEPAAKKLKTQCDVTFSPSIMQPILKPSEATSSSSSDSLQFSNNSSGDLNLAEPKDSIVADLLRAQLQSSTGEEESVTSKGPIFSSSFWSSPSDVASGEDGKVNQQKLSLTSGITIKKEKEDVRDPLEKRPHSVGAEESCSTSDHREDQLYGNQGLDFTFQETLQRKQKDCKSETSSDATSKNNVMDSILNSAIQAEYSGISLVSNSDSLGLNQAETLKINELLEASKCLTVPLCEDSNFNDLPDPSLIHVINLTEIAIRRLIKMAKRISAFKNFCQEDQIALLKAGCTEMMILRSVSAFDPDKEVWKIPQDHGSYQSIKVKVLQNASDNIYEEHKRFMLAFEPEWRQDAQIMALLSAISLFSPQRQNVIHYHAIDHEQKSYFFLLKRYLESQYGGCVGKTNYYRLLKIIGDLHILNMDHVRVFLEANPKEVEPLLIEIFELKNS